MESDNQTQLRVISHALKTPLASVQMMLCLLNEQKAGSLNEKQLFMVNQAMTDADRLLEAIDKHLNHSSSEDAKTDSLQST